jgi:hypothetical protein
MATPAELEAMKAAIAAGVVVLTSPACAFRSIASALRWLAFCRSGSSANAVTDTRRLSVDLTLAAGASGCERPLQS